MSDEISEIISEINKEKGLEDSLFLLDGPVERISVIPTGILAVDLATGVGGLPIGRMIEVFGAESAGKTTIAYSSVAQAQEMGLKTAFIDAEQTFDPVYAKSLGVDVHRLALGQPGSAEEAFAVIEALTERDFGFIVLDSIAAMPTKASLAGEIGQANVGVLAKTVTTSVARLTDPLNQHNTTLLMTNQLRQVVNVGGNPYGPKTYTPGGNALKHHCSMRLDVRRYHIKEGDGEKSRIVGGQVFVKVVKNKVAPPYGEGHFNIMLNGGIDHEDMLIDLAIKYGVMEQRASWVNHGDQKWQGRKNAKEWLRNNPSEAAAIKSLIQYRAVE